MSDSAHWLPWLRINPGFADNATAERVFVPAVDALAILDEQGADVLRAGLIAVLDETAPLLGGDDDQDDRRGRR